MTTPTVTLYQKNPLAIHLTQVDHGVRNINMPFFDADFRIYKGVTSNIDFVIRNNDRKPINLIGKSLSVTVIDHDTDTVKIEKPFVIIDEIKGKARLDFLPSEVVDWDVGFYNYAVLIENEDGTQNLLFTDQNDSAQGWFELAKNVLPQLNGPEDLGGIETWTPFHDGLLPAGTTRFRSSAIPGDAAHNANDGLHSIAIYLDNFTGRVWVQGSIEELVPNLEIDWFEIHLTPNQFELNFVGESGIQAFNFTANVTWIRILTEPDAILNQGTITKVLIKI